MGDLPAVSSSVALAKEEASGEGWVLPMSNGLTQTHGQDARATADIQTLTNNRKMRRCPIIGPGVGFTDGPSSPRLAADPTPMADTTLSTDPARQFSVFTENRLGRLFDLTSLLATQHVHVMAISVLDTTESAVVRLIVYDPEKYPRAAGQ